MDPYRNPGFHYINTMDTEILDFIMDPNRNPGFQYKKSNIQIVSKIQIEIQF